MCGVEMFNMQAGHSGIKKKAVGFTLFELIVVIVIISLLATVAIGKFQHLPTDARITKLKLVRAAVVSSAEVIHGRYRLKQGVADTQPCVDGGAVANNRTTLCTDAGLVRLVNGYPQALMPGQGPGIIAAAGLAGMFDVPLAELTQAGFAFAGGGSSYNSVLLIRITGGTDAVQCSFSYQPSHSASGGGAIISSINTGGC